MAPEVVLKQPYNEKADIFSLGCCLFEVRRVPGCPLAPADASRGVRYRLSSLPRIAETSAARHRRLTAQP